MRGAPAAWSALSIAWNGRAVSSAAAPPVHCPGKSHCTTTWAAVAQLEEEDPFQTRV